ncbi:MAG: sigma-54 dependent transcriptional regulator [Candidatus Omnitrophica bacterium]|nr:sigma-54 dependent transcriptional regulator [Candidatus Omnitrophota bacterium]
MKKILIVDDDKDLCFNLSSILKEEGHEVIVAYDGKQVLKAIDKNAPDLILLDIKLPGMDGVELLQEVKRKGNNLPIIMLTANSDVKSAVKAMKLGAYDYITKPFDDEELVLIIKKALHTQYLCREVEHLRKKLGQVSAPIEEAMGESPRIKQVLKHVDIIAATNMTVILQGESGTGKEVIARMIHEKSLRKDKPFVAIDCGAIPDTLVESELFGYEKGAFTGAEERKEGKFEQANGGTLFFDEITNIPNSIQIKLLRAVQERKFQHLGGKIDISVDVRIIVATNIGLSEAVRTGKFRDDLFHRLNEFHIDLPPLRQRKEDLPALTKYFLNEANRELDKKVGGFSGEAMRFLLDYYWPGNVRELKNVIKRAVLLADSKNITPACLSLNNGIHPAQSDPHPQAPIPNYKENASLREVKETHAGQIEEKMIKEAMVKAGGNKSMAARILKIDRTTLYSKIKEFQIS